MPAALIIAVHALRILSVSNGDHTISDVDVIRCNAANFLLPRLLRHGVCAGVWSEKLPFSFGHATAIAEPVMVLKL